jgi:hypothetical protein
MTVVENQSRPVWHSVNFFRDQVRRSTTSSKRWRTSRGSQTRSCRKRTRDLAKRLSTAAAVQQLRKNIDDQSCVRQIVQYQEFMPNVRAFRIFFNFGTTQMKKTKLSGQRLVKSLQIIIDFSDVRDIVLA